MEVEENGDCVFVKGNYSRTRL